ncbi:Hint domain-containing protein [Salipiger sp. P9]|uniref:Hint domain-containing protein n=1 Tax=Salipiger pentaromativorans TaxID=2943193 RepID=UPI0021586292|nr:Hint domain-containing protein [Salipiger pentaromativorans]MCR8546471.1 Hint domain-containing protein [Salipiger pentaromativorans]
MATISGSSGNDSLTGTAGDDTITGDAGNDTIIAGDGADSIDGGTGDDSIETGDGANTVDGGDGADYIFAGADNDSLSGGEGADSIHGNGGDDTVDGGGGNDTIYGDDGNDVMRDGAGDDLVYAGAGDDRIEIGSGNDTVYGHAGADVFVISADSGTNSIEDFTPGDGDLLAINYPGITTYDELAPYLSDDGNWGTLISLPDGSVTQVKWLNYGSLSASYFSFESGAVCLLHGTRIETAEGPRRVESLRPGDLLLTRDHGLQPLRFVSSTTYRFGDGPHRMKPIRMRKHALGQGYPERELRVSPQHRIAIPQEDPCLLVPARKLRDLPGVTDRPGCRLAQYYHLLLDRHELIEANGTWVETLLVTDYTIALARIPEALQGLAQDPVRPLASGNNALAAVAEIYAEALGLARNVA